LWLSRQEREHTEGNCNASEVITEVVENQRYIKRGKPINIVISEHFPVPAPLLTILAGNLLRNSLHYTQKGKVEISIYEGCISITDTGAGTRVTICCKALDSSKSCPNVCGHSNKSK